MYIISSLLFPGETLVHEKPPRSHPGSSSETASSSSSSHSYVMKQGVIAQAPPPAPPAFAPEIYDERPQEQPYSMDCESGKSSIENTLRFITVQRMLVGVGIFAITR